MENHKSTSSKVDRKTVERNRRNQMKALYSKLNSLVPHQSFKEVVSLPDQLEDAANYIKKLQTSVERMKERKENLRANNENNYQEKPIASMRSPQIEIHEIGPALEVVLITGLDFQFMFNETIRILHQEGVEIVNASFSVVDDTVFHSIHSQIGDSTSSNVAARIYERINKLVEDSNAF